MSKSGEIIAWPLLQDSNTFFEGTRNDAYQYLLSHVSKMLLFDAQYRPSSAELKNHKWLDNDALMDEDCQGSLHQSDKRTIICYAQAHYAIAIK